jgi:DDE superfamily endonuclease
MTKRLPSPPAPGPLEDFAANFDDLFGTLAQRRGFREYLQGLLLPRDRNKVLTALAGMEPIVGAQGAPAQRLQFFLSESAWDVAEIEARRLELIREDPKSSSAPHKRGVLVIDETGDRRDGTKTDHVGYQYLGSVGRIANGIVSVSSVWADERVYHPLHVEPYTPAKRLKKGRSDPAFRTKPQIAVELVARARAASIPFRAVVADCLYGENADFEGAMFKAKVPYVLSLRPHKGRWAEEEAAHTPEEAAQRMRWNSPKDPGDWEPIVRTFKDGHTEKWWAVEVSTLVGYGPQKSIRLVAVSTDPQTLPANSSWYLMTNLPVGGSPRAQGSPFEAADLCEVVRIYGLRQWVEQSFRQIKGELGFSDFQVRRDHAIRRHWEMVFCAFSFCWWAYTNTQEEHERAFTDPQPPDIKNVPEDEVAGGKRTRRRRKGGGGDSSVLAGGSTASKRMAGPLGNAVALLEGVVESAPTATTASAA